MGLSALRSSVCAELPHKWDISAIQGIYTEMSQGKNTETLFLHWKSISHNHRVSLTSHSPSSFCDQCQPSKIKKHHFFSVRGEQKIEASKRVSAHWLCCQEQDSQEHGERLLLLGRSHISTRLLAKLGFLNESKRRLSSSMFLGLEMQPTACKTRQGLRHANIQQGNRHQGRCPKS